jgi:hypothetical protein
VPVLAEQSALSETPFGNFQRKNLEPTMNTELHLSLLAVAANHLPKRIVQVEKQPTMIQDFAAYYAVHTLDSQGRVLHQSAGYVRHGGIGDTEFVSKFPSHTVQEEIEPLAMCA